MDARDPLGDCQSVLRLRAVARRRAPSSRLQRVAALMVSGVICYLLSVIRALIAVEAFTFFVGAALHLGVPVVGLDEPRILPAAIVEGLCGAILGAAAIWYHGQVGVSAPHSLHSRWRRVGCFLASARWRPDEVQARR